MSFGVISMSSIIVLYFLTRQKQTIREDRKYQYTDALKKCIITTGLF